MGYESIDSVIQAWTERHGLTLFDRLQGFPRNSIRTAYLSSNEGDCFQIWIDEPNSTHVAVHAATAETNTSKEFREEWLVPLHALDTALDVVLNQVRDLMTRWR